MTNILKYGMSLLIMGVLMLTSCNKKDKEVAIGKVFITNNEYPVNEYKFNLNVTIDGKSNALQNRIMKGDTVYKFPVRVTIPAQEKLVIKCSAAEAYITTYNQQNKANYALLPNDSYVFGKSEVTIEPGQYVSKDSIAVTLSLNKKEGILAGEYMLPLQVALTNSSGTIISSNMSMIKVFGNVEVLVLMDNIAKNNTLPTTNFINRVQWGLTASSSLSNNPLNNMLDGDKATSWSSNNESRNEFAIVNLDMQKENTIKGIQIAPHIQSLGDNSTQIQVFTSIDKKKWISQGRYNYTGPALTEDNQNSPDVLRNINFITPVSARYIRLKMYTDEYTGIAELNVY